jgi:hypothetical protein
MTATPKRIGALAAAPFGSSALVACLGVFGIGKAGGQHAGGRPAAPGTAGRAGSAGREGSSTGWQAAVSAEARGAGAEAPEPAEPRPASDSQPYAWSWPLSGQETDGAEALAPAEPAPVRPGLLTVLQDPAHSRPRAADLSEFLGQVVIAQCPHCGAFRIDADTQSQDWLFACCGCAYQWSWRPGTPWPEVHVRPAERRRPGRPS